MITSHKLDTEIKAAQDRMADNADTRAREILINNQLDLFAVVNLDNPFEPQIIPFPTGSALTSGVNNAKVHASVLNSAMKPEHQHYTVVRVSFDAEI